MIDLLRRRLADYAATDARQEEQALKEILQEVALYALWRADFFEVAAFQGGTSLRLLHGLRRANGVVDAARSSSAACPRRRAARLIHPTWETGDVPRSSRSVINRPRTLVTPKRVQRGCRDRRVGWTGGGADCGGVGGGVG